MQGLESAIFQKGWPCPVSTARKNPSQDFQNYHYFGLK